MSHMKRPALDASMHADTGPLSQNIRGMRAAKQNKPEPKNESMQKTIVVMRTINEVLDRPIGDVDFDARASFFSSDLMSYRLSSG